jgi:hypothetical protein
LEIYNVQGNQNRKTPYRLPRKKICDYAKSDKYFYKNLVAASNLPPVDQCPAVPKVKKPFFFQNIFLNFFFPNPLKTREITLLETTYSMRLNFQKILMESF